MGFSRGERVPSPLSYGVRGNAVSKLFFCTILACQYSVAIGNYDLHFITNRTEITYSEGATVFSIVSVAVLMCLFVNSMRRSLYSAVRLAAIG